MSPNASRGYFVTGTDTDIGKTYVCRVLADAFSKTMPTTYFKPIQTGCVAGQSGLRAPDFEYMLQGQIVQTASYQDHVPYRFAPACSPHCAARAERQDISFEHIGARLTNVMAGNNGPLLVIAEGAGGLYVPVTPRLFMLDLIEYLGFPVVLVTSPRLGTLNHTFLSINALRGRSIRLAGVVFNNRHDVPEDFIYEDNRETIRKAIHPAPFLELPYSAQQSDRIGNFCHELMG